MVEFFLYNKKDNEFKTQLKIVKQSVKILCKGAISGQYIDLDDNEYSHLIVSFSKGSTRAKQTPTTVLGFMLLTELDKNTIEVSLICVGNQFRSEAKEDASGLSKRLFESAYDLCKRENYNVLQLSALPYVINYYRKMGFRHILQPKCNGKDREPTKIKHLAEYFAQKKFKSDFDIHMRILVDKAIQLNIELANNKKTIKDMSKLETEIEELLDMNLKNSSEKKDYMDYFKKSKRTYGENKIITFFEELIKHGFSHECDSMDKIFRTRQYSDDDGDFKCMNDGFIMTKCMNIESIKKRPKCPNGSHKSPNTGLCVAFTKKNRKRCPNGSRRNKKTRRCKKK